MRYSAGSGGGTPRSCLAVLAAILLAACGAPQVQDQAQDQGQDPARDSAAAPQSFAAIGRDRVLAADSEPGQWLTSGRDSGKSHYSTLDQINKDTVSRLGFAWQYETGTTRGLQATPIVIDGVMYTSGTTGRAYALDARTGEEIWAFDPQSDGQVNRYVCCDEINRGVAVWDGMVYVASLDGRLFGLDAETGEVVWEQNTIIYPDRAYSITGAPEVAGGVVAIGNAGSDYDARGYVSAYDIKTGEFAWRFFVVPRDPALGPQEHPELEMALETWDPESRWDVGGGGTPWNAMVYDPELNLLYVGTGNSALFHWAERSPSGGDNLFLASILAIDPDTGRLVWHYQQAPMDSWDYTATQPMILTDLEVDGQMRRVLMQAPKTGYFYVLDRATGELLRAHEYVPVNWATGIDMETGRPQISPHALDLYTPQWIVPSGMGGHAWNPMAWDAERGLVYIPTIEGGAVTWDATEGHVFRPRQPNSGLQILFGDSLYANPDMLPGPMGEKLREVQESGEHVSYSALKAFDPLTGEVAWERRTTDYWDRGGVLATAAGLVFQGDDRGWFRAIDSDTGETVFEVEIGTSIVAAPMTYELDGVQYIALMAGWGGGGWFAPADTSAVVQRGNDGRIIAFRLDGGAVPVPPEKEGPGPIAEPPARTADAETVAQGSRLFGSCRQCHANTATSATPDLRRSPLLHSRDGFNAVVLEGAMRLSGMPQWDDIMGEAESDAIRDYLIDEAWRAYEAQQEGRILEQDVIPSEIAR